MMMLSGTLSSSHLVQTGENKELTKWARVWILDDDDGVLACWGYYEQAAPVFVC
jgi:hypothetical protein